MNLLQELSHEILKQVFDEAGDGDVNLGHLINCELVHGLPDEFLSSPIGVNSFLLCESEKNWYSTLNVIPEVSDEESSSIVTWTVGVPYCEGLILLMPDGPWEGDSLQLSVASVSYGAA
ncbi:hypothetical protein ACFYWX_04895 [Streptomyces sp. NPDC002888]|uniref:hypothetical protein n=1 Tax=Streptomyces sp. NPDC002888 TaxID=3364668 RepID=UPI00367DD500